MPAGLGLVLSRARQRPVYMAVVDGLWHLRSFTDTALRIAGTRVRVTIRGPYTIPSDRAEIDKFIQELRETMVETLNSGRSAPTPTPCPCPSSPSRRLIRACGPRGPGGSTTRRRARPWR